MSHSFFLSDFGAESGLYWWRDEGVWGTPCTARARPQSEGCWPSETERGIGETAGATEFTKNGASAGKEWFTITGKRSSKIYFMSVQCHSLAFSPWSCCETTWTDSGCQGFLCNKNTSVMLRVGLVRDEDWEQLSSRYILLVLSCHCQAKELKVVWAHDKQLKWEGLQAGIKKHIWSSRHLNEQSYRVHGSKTSCSINK